MSTFLTTDLKDLVIPIPKIVFIVPYRNRPQHKFYFSNYLTSILKDSYVDYEIYFSHQCDDRSFNRGATKNIGFLAIKQKYPNDYKNITFVFNDIDTLPFSNIFDYQTIKGVVKHFYGFKYALGGIVSICGHDFELTNGYPNFWGWGMEDKVLQMRCESNNLIIDRKQFYPIGSPDILQLFDGVSRLINSKEPQKANNDNGIDGLKTLHQLTFQIDDESKNPLDNIHIVVSDKIFVINIDTFLTCVPYENGNYFQYDLREPQKKIMNPTNVKSRKSETILNDWTNIPYYPNAEKKMALIQKYGKEKAEEIIKYSYINSVDPTTHVMPPAPAPTHHPINNIQQIQQYNQKMQQMNSNVRIIPPNINKYSPEYSRIIAPKNRASTSGYIQRI